MNIFYTNENPIQAANDHCKIHCRKMIVEYAQLLSTAHHILDGDNCIDGIYKKTHANHPSAIWVRSNILAYDWVLVCALELCRLYTNDTGKKHKTQSILELLKVHPRYIPVRSWVDPTVAAPDKFKSMAIFGGSAIAYREYLKDKFLEWKQRERPIKVEFTHIPDWL